VERICGVGSCLFLLLLLREFSAFAPYQLLSFVEPSSGRVDALYFDQALVQVASLLRRYLAEYDFRYHRVKLGYNDGERAALAVKNATGKRLTYRGPT
jgi:hypothetical protein